MPKCNNCKKEVPENIYYKPLDLCYECAPKAIKIIVIIAFIGGVVAILSGTNIFFMLLRPLLMNIHGILAGIVLSYGGFFILIIGVYFFMKRKMLLMKCPDEKHYRTPMKLRNHILD